MSNEGLFSNTDNWQTNKALLLRHFRHKSQQSTSNLIESGIALGFETASDLPSWLLTGRGALKFATRFSPSVLKPYIMPAFMTALSIPIFWNVGKEAFIQFRDARDAHHAKNICETATGPEDFEKAGLDYETLVKRATASEHKIEKCKLNVSNDNRPFLTKMFEKAARAPASIAKAGYNYAIGTYESFRDGIPATIKTLANARTSFREARGEEKILNRAGITPQMRSDQDLRTILEDTDENRAQDAANAKARFGNLTSIAAATTFIGLASVSMMNPVSFTAGLMGFAFSIPALRESFKKQSELEQENIKINSAEPTLRARFTGALERLQNHAKTNLPQNASPEAAIA